MTIPFYLEGHLPLLAKVRLVADQNHHDFSREEIPLQVLQPLLSLAEGILKKEKKTSDKSYGHSSSALPGKEKQSPWPHCIKHAMILLTI